MNKSQFIRTQPLDTPVNDVIAAAKAKHLKITPGLVYGVRSAMKTVTVTKTPEETAAAPEALLLAVAAEIGLGRAIEILTTQRETVLRVLKN